MEFRGSLIDMLFIISNWLDIPLLDQRLVSFTRVVKRLTKLRCHKTGLAVSRSCSMKLHKTEYFDAFPRSVKRAILEWIASAKRTETRANRIEETVTKAEKNIRANQWRQ